MTLMEFAEAKHRPELVDQWNAEANGGLTPGTITIGSDKRIWWRCALGHEYETRLDSRVSGTGCPYCAGRKAWPGFNDLTTLFPEVAAEWHPTLNGSLTPDQVTKGGKQKVWWRCDQGHVWKAALYARTRKNGTGCPVCGRRGRHTTKQGGNFI